VLLYRYLQRPKVADLLIETEGELRKVTWPKLEDVTNSSLVVVFCVLFLMGFLAAADYLLGRLIGYFLLGS
jgi:preprotein translocase SecE subunit